MPVPGRPTEVGGAGLEVKLKLSEGASGKPNQTARLCVGAP